MRPVCGWVLWIFVIILFRPLAADAGQPLKPGSLPCPLDADLWLLAGQSNMEGCGRVLDKSKPDSKILMLGMDDRWTVAEDPLHRLFESNHPVIKKYYFSVHKGNEQSFTENRKKSRTDPAHTIFEGAGMGLPFAHHLRQFIRRPIGLIPCAYGGTLMKDWDPALKERTTDSLYSYMIQRARSAVGEGKAKIRGVLWSQGEGDGCYPEMAEKYEATMVHFIDSLRRDLGDPELPFLLVQTGRFCTAGSPQPGPLWEKVREGQRRIANQRRAVYLVSSLDVPLDDPIHISQAGHQIIGRRLAEIALREVYHKKGHAGMIRLESIEYVDKNQTEARPCFDAPYQFRLRFNGVNGRLTAPGRPAGFEFRSDPSAKNIPMFFRTEFDPRDPAIVILSLAQPGFPLEKNLKLVHGGGMDPYVNICDEKGMALPAFGPIALPTPEKPRIVYP